MAELKPHLMLNREMSWIPCYLKSEADEVLAELKSDYEEACGRLQTANLIKDEQLVATRHQKYKRCKAIARWCFTKSNYHFVVGRSEGGKTGMTHYRISRLYSKWYKRWFKIAEQFKEAKCR